MENQKSGQIIRFILLFLACFFLTRQFFNPPEPPGPPRAVPKIEQAFARTFGANKLTQSAAEAELKEIDKAIGGFAPQADAGFWSKLLGGGGQNSNSSDEYSYWARLRAGLIHQYVLKDKDEALRLYEQILASYTSDAIYAQTLYQKGDLLWHTSKPGEVQRDNAAHTLEQLVVRGRGATRFFLVEIFVPQPPPSKATNPAEAVLAPTSFQKTTVEKWRSTYGAPPSEGLPDRVDAYYTKILHFGFLNFHTIFDQTAALFGNNPQYSYGLALLFFAVVLRIVLQPVTKKQYNSMKGMAEVGPELKKIQEKYKDKPEKQMDILKETRELYKARGVNPQLGCMLGLVQIPIFFFIVYPFIQHYEAKLDLIGASFLWIQNLARPDFPLLIAYAISQFLSFRLSATPPSDPQQAQMQGIMAFVFPLTVPLFLKDWPSAFTLYWMMFNIISTFFQWRMMRANNPERSVLKAIFESPMAGVRAAEAAAGNKDAIPSHPNSQSGSKQTGSKQAGSKQAGRESSTRGESGFNGAGNGNNGASNGMAKSGANKNKSKNGTVIRSVSSQELSELDADDQDSAVATATSPISQNKTARRRRRRRR